MVYFVVYEQLLIYCCLYVLCKWPSNPVKSILNDSIGLTMCSLTIHIKIKMICVVKGGQMMDSTLPLAW